MKCKTPACERPGSKSRGLCGSCYNYAARMVARGETTWEALEELDLVGPSLVEGAGRPAKFGDAFRRATTSAMSRKGLVARARIAEENLAAFEATHPSHRGPEKVTQTTWRMPSGEVVDTPPPIAAYVPPPPLTLDDYCEGRHAMDGIPVDATVLRPHGLAPAYSRSATWPLPQPHEVEPPYFATKAPGGKGFFIWAAGPPVRPVLGWNDDTARLNVFLAFLRLHGAEWETRRAARITAPDESIS